MIETIFYFAQNPAEYESNKSLLSERTISFVPNADGTNTGKIYKYGVQYGGSNYSLPKASASTLGGIMTNYTTSGSNYGVRIDNNGNAYVNVPSTGGGGGGTTTIENPYDDTEIRNIITTINSDLDVIKARVSAAVIADMQEAINKYKAFIAKYGEDALIHIPNNWDEELQAFVLQVIRTDADGNGATWSELVLKYDSLSAKVTSISKSITVDGDITYESLISSLNSYIDTEVGAAFASLKTEWDLTDEDLNVLKWLSSGFDSSTTSTGTFADVYSASQDAIAALHTEVDTLKNQTVASLSARMDNYDTVSGLYLKADSNSATANLVVGDGSDNVAGMLIKAINNGTTSAKIAADKIELSGQTLSVDVKDLKIGNQYAFNTDTIIGTDLVGSDNIITFNANTLPSGTVYLAKNVLLIGTDGSSFDLGGLIGAYNLVGDSVWANGIQTTYLEVEEDALVRGKIYGELYPAGSALEKYHITGEESYLRNLTVEGGDGLIANKITLNGQTITEWPSGTTSGASGTYTLELLNGTATFTNGVLTAFTQHNNNLTLSLS